MDTYFLFQSKLWCPSLYLVYLCQKPSLVLCFLDLTIQLYNWRACLLSDNVWSFISKETCFSVPGRPKKWVWKGQRESNWNCCKAVCFYQIWYVVYRWLLMAIYILLDFLKGPVIFQFFSSFCIRRHFYTEDQETLHGYSDPKKSSKVKWWTLWSAPDHDS